MRAVDRVPEADTLNWVGMKMAEAERIVHAFAEIMNEEFARAWGTSEELADDLEIVETCRLFAEMCRSSLQWEEGVRFVSLAPGHEGIQERLMGMAGMMIDEAAKLP